MQIDQQTTECVKQINQLGQTTYQNICNGQTAVIPWGSGDWVGFILLGSLALAVVVMLFGTIWTILTGRL